MPTNLKRFKEEIKERGRKENFSMPDENMPISEKSKPQYFLAVAQYLFYLGAEGKLYRCGLLDNNSKFSELRKYAKGDVPIEKYQEHIVGKDKDGKRNKTLINISWRPDLGYINTLSQMAGSYDKMDYDLRVYAIDPSSDYERKVKIETMKIDIDGGLKALANNVGVPYLKDQDSDTPDFESEEDIDLYVKAGGLKLKSEIKMQKAINKTKNHCNWRILKDMLARDVRDLGIACVKDHVDYSAMTASLRYVDPDNLLIPHSKYNDFRDITIAGEMRTMRISDLRVESDLEEEELYRIALKYGYNQSISKDTSILQETSVKKNMPYDHILVNILDCSWLSNDLSYFSEKYIEKYGVLEFKKRDEKYKITQAEMKRGRTMRMYKIQYTYKTSWIIGTDKVYGYGKDYYIPREGKKGNRKAILPYHVCSTGEPSKLERIIADIDAINIITYKRRNAIANIPAPPGIVVNKSALEKVSFAGEIKSPVDLHRMLIEKGILAVDTEDEFGNKTESINNFISYVQTNLSEQFNIFSEQIAEHRRNIQISTGYNDVVDGSSDNERRLKIEGEAKLEAANNAMQIEYGTMRNLIERSFRSIMFRWQEIAKFDDIEIDETPLSKDDLETIKLTAEISRVKFDLNVTLSAGEDERRMLLQELVQMKQVRAETGNGGIGESDYIMLYRTIMQDNNISLAQILLAKAKKDQERKDEERSARLQEQNAQVQAQAAAQAEEEKRKSMFMEAALRLIEKQFESQNRILEMLAKTDLEDGMADNEIIRNLLQQTGNPENVDMLLNKVQEKINMWGQGNPQGQASELAV